MFGSRRQTRWTPLGVAILTAALAFACSRGLAADAGIEPAPPAPAARIVSEAVQTAAAGAKVVLIEFGASWCPWCRQFEAFVHAPQTAAVVAANYVVVNLVVQESEDKKALENPGGQDLMDKWGGAKAGLPFYVFLDATGRKIADSNAMPDGGNIGFPGTEKEIQAFLGLLGRTAPRLSAADRSAVAAYLQATLAR
jgi:thiol:disulfide interchange protein